jgi:hypothetical protein
MLDERQQAQAYFRTLMITVVGQAFGAAGYTLDDNPTRALGGLFQWQKPLESGLHALIAYQVLVYAAGTPSRFRVMLTRTRLNANKGAHDVQRTLSALVVEDFGVNILPHADHWWTYSDTQTLGKALAEAGYLAVGYGIPFLEGALLPPTRPDLGS